MLNKNKTWILILVMLLNTLIYLGYTILDLMKIKNVSNIDYSLMLIYYIASMVIATELIHERKKDKND